MPESGIHISDTHCRVESFARIHEIARRFPNDHLLLTGDVTDQGAPLEYHTMCRKTPYSLPLPGNCRFGKCVYLCPGNHDCFEGQGGVNWLPWKRKGLRTFDATFRTGYYGLNEPHVYEFPGDGGVLILLDSNCENFLFSAAHGRVGRRQRRSLDRLLDVHKGKAVLVGLHHHPFERTPFHCMLDAKKFMSIVEGRIQGLFFGHKHYFEHCRGAQQKYGIPHIRAAGAVFEEMRVVRWTIDQGRLHTTEHLIP